jgi:hypothetical protein
MSSQMDLKDVEKRVIRMINFEDGLWDLLLGLIFMALAVYPVTRRLLGPEWNLVLFLAIMAVTVVGQQWARRRVAGPRMGRVRPRRTPKLRMVLIVVILLVVATLGMVILTLASPGWLPPLAFGPGWLRSYAVDIGAMVLVVGVFSLMAYQFSVARMVLYGFLIGGGNLASVVLERTAGLRFNLPLALAAVVILLIGIARLIRFLRAYPVREAAV